MTFSPPHLVLPAPQVEREEMRQRLLGRAKSSGRVDDEEEVIEKRLNTLLRFTGEGNLGNATNECK